MKETEKCFGPLVFWIPKGANFENMSDKNQRLYYNLKV